MLTPIAAMNTASNPAAARALHQALAGTSRPAAIASSTTGSTRAGGPGRRAGHAEALQRAAGPGRVQELRGARDREDGRQHEPDSQDKTRHDVLLRNGAGAAAP
jgi:hypothetical protein